MKYYLNPRHTGLFLILKINELHVIYERSSFKSTLKICGYLDSGFELDAQFKSEKAIIELRVRFGFEKTSKNNLCWRNHDHSAKKQCWRNHDHSAKT